MALQPYSIALDTATQLKDAGLVAATATGTVGGSAAVADLGGGYAEFYVVIDWTACEVASGDEKYDLVIEGAPTSAFSVAYVLGRLILGDSSVTNHQVDTSPSGRMVIHCNNGAITSATDGNSVSPMRFVRVNARVAGTVATGLNYTAWLTAKQ
jgi:hypothetical protein